MSNCLRARGAWSASPINCSRRCCCIWPKSRYAAYIARDAARASTLTASTSCAFREDAAARRSAAARFVKQFPALLSAVADGELHLTGLLMLGPRLTPENQLELLGRARFRTKKELAKLVRELNPLPGVPDLVAPLGPAPMQPLHQPTWAKFVESLCPAVRDLAPGERPRDWANDGDETET